MTDLDRMLAAALERQASDLHLKAGVAPRVRLEGRLVELEPEPFSRSAAEALARELVGDREDRYNDQGSCDLSYHSPAGRFRVSVFRQHEGPSFVFRAIPAAPAASKLGLPKTVAGWALRERGLVLVTGPTGSGKSTTCAALIDRINSERDCHIVTIEDPIEFLHSDRRALINQREVGRDLASPAEGLRAALRQDPDVILIGEIRDEQTAETALRAAETGHLVFATMHTQDAVETVSRLIGLFPEHSQALVRQLLASTLIGVASQRLVPGTSGRRILATEVLVASARVRDMILSGEALSDLAGALAEGEFYGMQSFDQDLARLVAAGTLTSEDAILHASSPHDLRMLLGGVLQTRTGDGFSEFFAPQMEEAAVPA